MLGVLAGEDLSLDALRRWADTSDLVIAADSGADRLLACGARIDLLIGDLDSASPQAQRSAAEVLHIEEQDSTDCDKLLRVALERGHTGLTLISVEGSQPDHALATLHSAVRSPLSMRIAYRRGIGSIVREGGTTILTHAGERVSLLPITECSGVNLSGVKWPLENVGLSPTGKTSVSNVATQGRVVVRLNTGHALLYRECGPDPDWS